MITRNLSAIYATTLVALSLTAGAADFQTRCADPNVVKCVGFDAAGELIGTYGNNSGVLPGATVPTIDAAIKASGGGSVKFTIPSNTAANTSGEYFTNFSPDLSVQFGGGTQFFVQWRQRFSPEFLNTRFVGGGGWKQAIIATGDKPNRLFPSCVATTIVTQNTYHRGFPQLYNSCTGSASHGPYSPFEEVISNDFKMQNARASPFCLYSQGTVSPPRFFPPTGNCFGYFPNEWMTFQLQIIVGPRIDGEFKDSHVNMWVGREGQPSELVFDFGPYNLTAGASADNEEYGKIWLLPYNTGKDSTQVHPTGYTWYDELIISRAKIAEPTSSGDGIVPRPPTNVTAQ